MKNEKKAKLRLDRSAKNRLSNLCGGLCRGLLRAFGLYENKFALFRRNFGFWEMDGCVLRVRFSFYRQLREFNGRIRRTCVRRFLAFFLGVRSNFVYATKQSVVAYTLFFLWRSTRGIFIVQFFACVGVYGGYGLARFGWLYLLRRSLFGQRFIHSRHRSGVCVVGCHGNFASFVF